jgi:hypothetical protein
MDEWCHDQAGPRARYTSQWWYEIEPAYFLPDERALGSAISSKRSMGGKADLMIRYVRGQRIRAIGADLVTSHRVQRRDRSGFGLGRKCCPLP